VLLFKENLSFFNRFILRNQASSFMSVQNFFRKTNITVIKTTVWSAFIYIMTPYHFIYLLKTYNDLEQHNTQQSQESIAQ